MWKANGKTTTLQLLLDSLSPKTEKLSLEGTMDLSRDRLILELEVLRAVVVKSTIFWDITPCNPFRVNRRFGEIYSLLLQGQKNKFSEKPA
jgi:ABC-type uncharacterized transport system ATPase subunit